MSRYSRPVGEAADETGEEMTREIRAVVVQAIPLIVEVLRYPPAPMVTLYRHLDELGFSEQRVREVLPDWWEDEIAQNPSGYAQALVIISRALGVEISSLPTAKQA